MVRPLSSLAKFSFVISNIRFSPRKRAAWRDISMPASHYACQSLQIRLGSFTSPAATDRCSRDCAAADMQVIGRKAHPPTSLNGWVGCQNDAVCESSCLPDNLGFPRMQAVSVEAQDRPHPIRRQINAGPYQQVLPGLSRSGRIAAERMIVRNSNTMSERSSRPAIAWNNISNSISDVGAPEAP